MESTKCKSCGVPIVYVRTSRGELIPVDLESLGPDEVLAVGELHHVPGVHRSHFGTCPDAAQFRRVRPGNKRGRLRGQ